MTGPAPNKTYPGAIHGRMSFSSTYPNTLNDQYSGFGFRGFGSNRQARPMREIRAVTDPDTSNHIPEQITPTSFQAFKFMMFLLPSPIKHHLLRLWLGTV